MQMVRIILQNDEKGQLEPNNLLNVYFKDIYYGR